MTPRDVASLASAHGLEITPGDIAFNEVGLDLRVAFVTAADRTRWVLRIPRRPDVVAGAKNEARTLALVREHLTVAVPDWRIRQR